MVQTLRKYILYLAWIQALAATFGSLFFSEILKYPPCVLCWYQRIAMYPLVLILPIGIIKKDKQIGNYVMPLAVAGLLVAAYHNLLYYGLISEKLTPCVNGVSCTTRFFEFGFISIPLLSLLSFMGIIACILLFNRWTHSHEPRN